MLQHAWLQEAVPQLQLAVDCTHAAKPQDDCPSFDIIADASGKHGPTARHGRTIPTPGNPQAMHVTPKGAGLRQAGKLTSDGEAM